MVRPLHKKEDEKKDMMHIVIHKILPGDPYYKVFDGDQAKARRYTNKIWQRLLDRYNTMLI
ncbi:GL10500 [Drosophila persimilis]|uniref:GL10500 n=2 Tax=Drosophila persimilis TaxID=7234 RepID=B4GBQ7_DROPE|nr:GL10500 [Drosophila persimilis]